MKLCHFITVSLLLTSWFAVSPPITRAEEQLHLVISQIKISGGSATDEFVELYNPTDAPIDLAHFKLQKRTASGTASNLISEFPSHTIAPRGFFLITHSSGYVGALTADLVYTTTASLAPDNSVALIDGTGMSVDLVGWGASDQFEGAPAQMPPSNGSIERLPGNELGNGADTDSNQQDFVLKTEATPRNSGSPALPAALPPPEPIPLPNPIFTIPVIAELEMFAPEPHKNEPDPPALTQIEEPPSELLEPATGEMVEIPELVTTDIPVPEPVSGPQLTVVNVPTPPPPSPRSPMRGSLLISEIVSQPANGDEWIEIVNMSADEIALGNVRVRDGGNHLVAFHGSIMPGSYRILTLPSAILNNSGDLVELIGSDDSALDELIYGDWETALIKYPTPEKGQSLARLLPDTSFRITTTITPGTQNTITEPASNSLPSNSNQTVRKENTSLSLNTAAAVEEASLPKQYPRDTLIISELYPVPYPGEEEWIEIVNPGTSELILAGWYLTDERGTKTPLTGSLAAGAFHLTTSPRGHLNNGGDVVIIFDPSGSEVSRASYGKIARGESYARAEDGWQTTVTPTPGRKNLLMLPEEETEPPIITTEIEASNYSSPLGEVEPVPSKSTASVKREKPAVKKSSRKKLQKTIATVSLAEARELETGTIIKTSGVVSVAPGILGSRTFYLAGSGMQIYLHGGEVPTLSLGDRVEVRGKLGSSGGEKRLVVSGSGLLTVIDHGVPPDSEPIEIGMIDDEIEGWLVSIEGTVTEKLNGRLVVEDPSGAIPVIIKPNTLIDQRAIGIGDRVRLVGIASETKSGFRLLPRSVDDISVIEIAAPTPKEKSNWRLSLFSILAVLLLSALLGMIVRKYVVQIRKSKLTLANQAPPIL